MATGLFMAAALAVAQAQAAPPMPPWGVRPAPGDAPAAQPVTPPEAPVVSTTPQDDLDSPPTVNPFQMPAETHPVPVRYETADAAANTPVKVEDYHRSYEGPQDAEEAYYDAGVKTAFEAEQAQRGPLEGMWVVSAADGAPLLSLVISDPGRPGDPPGGAWRDLSRAHDPDASGLIDQVVEEGASVILQIRLKAGAPPATLRLTTSADGRWRGLLVDGGAPKPVIMDRKPI